jgi:DNA-binding protein HU-beta
MRLLSRAGYARISTAINTARCAAHGALAGARWRPGWRPANPATGEAIQIKASKKVAFRPAKELKEAV